MTMTNRRVSTALLLIALASTNGVEAFSTHTVSRSTTFSSTTLLPMSTIGDPAASDLAGQTLYQRAFFRLETSTAQNKLVIEERLRYRVLDPIGQPDFAQPVGPRTLVLRDGAVADGKIGDVIGVIQVPHGNHNANGPSAHEGMAKAWERTYATALTLLNYAEPTVTEGRLLQVAAAQGHDLGLATLIAAWASGALASRNKVEQSDDLVGADDLVDTAASTSLQLPKGLQELTLSDNGPEMAENLDLMRQLIQQDVVVVEESDDADIMPTANSNSNHKINIDGDSFPWNAPQAARRYNGMEYNTVVASDLAKLTFPETKALSKTVAHALAGYASQPATTTGGRPTFIYVAQEEHCAETVGYLQKLLRQGYGMSVDNDHNDGDETTIPTLIPLESIRFAIQKVETTQITDAAAEEAALDDLMLEVQDCTVTDYRCLTAQHDPAYAGGGAGDVFFPMETGLYDQQQQQQQQSSYLEPEQPGGGWLGQ